jgi:colicin import membrane protein
MYRRCKTPHCVLSLLLMRKKSPTSAWRRSISSTRKTYPTSAKASDLRPKVAAAVAAAEAKAAAEAWAAAEAKAAAEAWAAAAVARVAGKVAAAAKVVVAAAVAAAEEAGGAWGA